MNTKWWQYQDENAVATRREIQDKVKRTPKPTIDPARISEIVNKYTPPTPKAPPAPTPQRLADLVQKYTPKPEPQKRGGLAGRVGEYLGERHERVMQGAEAARPVLQKAWDVIDWTGQNISDPFMGAVRANLMGEREQITAKSLAPAELLDAWQRAKEYQQTRPMSVNLGLEEGGGLLGKYASPEVSEWARNALQGGVNTGWSFATRAATDPLNLLMMPGVYKHLLKPAGLGLQATRGLYAPKVIRTGEAAGALGELSGLAGRALNVGDVAFSAPFGALGDVVGAGVRGVKTGLRQAGDFSALDPMARAVEGAPAAKGLTPEDFAKLEAKLSANLKPGPRMGEGYLYTETLPEYVDKMVKHELSRYEGGIKSANIMLEKLSPRATAQRKDWAMKARLWQHTVDKIKSGDIGYLQKQFTEEYIGRVTKGLSKGYAIAPEVIAQNPVFAKAVDARARYEKGLHTSFANRSKAINESTMDRGFKVKRQDGKDILPAQIEETITAVDAIENALGPVGDAMRLRDLTISHTSGKHPFLSTAAGEYHVSDRSVSIGVRNKWSGEDMPVLGHEFGHYLDHTAGEVRGLYSEGYMTSGKRVGNSYSQAEYVTNPFNREKLTPEQLEFKGLLDEAKRSMADTYAVRKVFKKHDTAALSQAQKALEETLKVKLGHYWSRPVEIWARLVEQYIADVNGVATRATSALADYYNLPGWWKTEEWARLKPRVQAEVERQLATVREAAAMEFKTGAEAMPAPDLAAKAAGVAPADSMVDVIALGSPSGRMSAAALKRAQARNTKAIFGEGGLKRPQGPVVDPVVSLRRQAEELNRLADGGMHPISYKKKALELEAQAAALEAKAAPVQAAPEPKAAGQTDLFGNAAEYPGAARPAPMETQPELFPGAIDKDEMLATSGVKQREAAQAPAVETPIAAVAKATPAENLAESAQFVDKFPMSRLRLDPKRFQFKWTEMADAATGQTKELRGQPYNRKITNPIGVWKDGNGDVWVVNGHQRYGMAKDTGVSHVPIAYMDVSTDSAARALGALQNIAEGRGTPMDAAKWIRDTGLTAADLVKEGVSLKGSVAKTGLALSKLNDTLFNRVVQGTLPESRGAIIGNLIADSDVQMQIVKRLDELDARGRVVNDKVFTELVESFSAAPRVEVTQNTLFGEESFTQSLAVERAELAAAVSDSLGATKRVMGTAVKHTGTLEAVGSKIAVKASEKAKVGAEQAIDVFARMKNLSGPVSEMLDDGARRIANGESVQTVARDLTQDLSDNLRAIVAGRKVRGATRVQEVGQNTRPVEQAAPPAPEAAAVAPANTARYWQKIRGQYGRLLTDRPDIPEYLARRAQAEAELVRFGDGDLNIAVEDLKGARLFQQQNQAWQIPEVDKIIASAQKSIDNATTAAGPITAPIVEAVPTASSPSLTAGQVGPTVPPAQPAQPAPVGATTAQPATPAVPPGLRRGPYQPGQQPTMASNQPLPQPVGAATQPATPGWTGSGGGGTPTQPRMPGVIPPRGPVGDELAKLRVGLTQEGKPPLRDRLAQTQRKAIEQLLDRNTLADGLQRETGVTVHDAMQIVPGARVAGEAELNKFVHPVLKRVGKDFDRLQEYMTANRMKDALDWQPDMKLAGAVMDPDRALAQLRAEIGPQRWAQVETAARELWDLNDQLVLQPRLAEGLLSQEGYDAIRQRWPHYIPFMRQGFDDFDVLAKGLRSEADISSTIIKRMQEEGSERALKNPIEMYQAQVIKTQMEVSRNQAAKALRDALEQAGTQRGETLIQILRQGDEAPSGTAVMHWFEDGQMVRAAVPTEYAAMAKGLNAESANALSRLVLAMSKPLRVGAVSANPAFLLANKTRDAMSAWYREGLVPLSKYDIQGWVAAITKNADFYDAAKSGSLLSGLSETIMRGADIKAPKHLGALSIKSPMDAFLLLPRLVMKANEISEQATRIAVFKKLKAAGLTDLEAAVRSRNATVDFSKSGNLTRMLNQAIPFLNAGIQGSANTVNMMRTKPGTALLRAAPLGMASVLFFAWNQRYETAGQIPDYEYANNWVIQVGEGEAKPDPKYPTKAPERFPIYVKIPKGPMGAFLTAPVETLLKVAWANDDRSVVEHIIGGLETAGRAMLPIEPTASAVVPPLLGTALQLQSNRDFFRGRDIVPQSEMSRPETERYGVETSDTARLLGETFGVSPRVIDFAIQDYTAGAGQAMTWLADLGLNALGYNPETNELRQAKTTAQELSTTPVVGRFLGTKGNQPERVEYERLDKAAEAMRKTLYQNPEVKRLAMGFNPPGDTVTVDGTPMEIPPAKRTEIVNATTPLVKQAFDLLAQKDFYKAASDVNKKKMLDTVRQKITDNVRGNLLVDITGEKPKLATYTAGDMPGLVDAYGVYALYQDKPSVYSMLSQEESAQITEAEMQYAQLRAMFPNEDADLILKLYAKINERGALLVQLGKKLRSAQSKITASIPKPPELGVWGGTLPPSQTPEWIGQALGAQ